MSRRPPSTVAALRRWHNNRGKLGAVFIRQSECERVFGKNSDMGFLPAYTIDGVRAWPVPDKDMPCRFMKVPAPFFELVRLHREMREKVAVIDTAIKMLKEIDGKLASSASTTP